MSFLSSSYLVAPNPWETMQFETGGRLPLRRSATGGAAMSSDTRINDLTANELKGM
jgi:hypothetical protein